MEYRKSLPNDKMSIYSHKLIETPHFSVYRTTNIKPRILVQEVPVHSNDYGLSMRGLEILFHLLWLYYHLRLYNPRLYSHIWIVLFASCWSRSSCWRSNGKYWYGKTPISPAAISTDHSSCNLFLTKTKYLCVISYGLPRYIYTIV